MTAQAPELSIVIPCYNEEKRLGRGLERLRDYFQAQPSGLAGIEIIVVDDGSSDKTLELAREWARKLSCVQVFWDEKNHGKGYAVREGMLNARGRIALFTDTDLSAPIEESKKLFAAIEAGNQVAIGSRAIDRSLISVHQTHFREMAGIIFNVLVRVLIGLPFEDTQCGFKAFLREPCKVIFEQQRIDGFGFDPVILFLARRHGLKVAEVPVRWAHDPATKLHVFRDSLRMLADLLHIRWNWLAGRYPKK